MGGPARLDPSFGAGGKVTTAIGTRSRAGAVALQPDGKILVAGSTVDEAGEYQFAVVRYTADGSLDPSFGAGGAVTTPFGPGVASASALVLAPDGRIVAAGRGGSDFALARYDPNGSLDTTFGDGGKVTTAFADAHEAGVAEIALQPDGKIVAAGTILTPANYDFALARYDPNGLLDTGFGTGGKVTTSIGPNHDFASSLALRPDGKLVVAGFSEQLSGDGFALARYNADGSLDEQFGTGPVAGTTVTGSSGWAEAMVLQPDGKILAAGWIYAGRDVYDFGLVRYKANGSLDAGFGKRGTVRTSFGPGLRLCLCTRSSAERQGGRRRNELPPWLLRGRLRSRPLPRRERRVRRSTGDGRHPCAGKAVDRQRRLLRRRGQDSFFAHGDQGSRDLAKPGAGRQAASERRQGRSRRQQGQEERTSIGVRRG